MFDATRMGTITRIRASSLARGPEKSDQKSFTSSPTWWLWRGGCTRSHSELGRETPQRRWYYVSRRGRVGRCQVCQEVSEVSRSKVVRPDARLISSFQCPYRTNPIPLSGVGFVVLVIAFWLTATDRLAQCLSAHLVGSGCDDFADLAAA